MIMSICRLQHWGGELGGGDSGSREISRRTEQLSWYWVRKL